LLCSAVLTWQQWASKGFNTHQYHSAADLETFPDGGELRPCHLDLSTSHVCRLFGIERVSNTSHDEHVQLLTSSPILLLLLRPLRAVFPRAARPAAVRRRQRRARTGGTDAVGSGRVSNAAGLTRGGAETVETAGRRSADTEPHDWTTQRCRTRCCCQRTNHFLNILSRQRRER